MDNSNVRNQVTELLGQIATLIGGTSTTPLRVPAETGVEQSSPISRHVVQSTSTPVVGVGQRQSQPSVLSELRNRFAPYAHTSGQRPRAAERSAMRRRSGVMQNRNWCCKFFCLSKPGDVTTLSTRRRLRLSSCGLGDSIVTTGTNASITELERAIRTTFPKLNGTEIELLRGIGGGNNKPLIRISTTEAIPSVQSLKAARINTIYIRPANEIQILSPDDSEEDDEPTPCNNMSSNSQTYNNNNQPSSSNNVSLPGRSTSILSPLNNSVNPTERSYQFTSTLNAPIIFATVTSEDFGTLEDFRSKAYLENPGEQYIGISRGDFLERLFGVYKNPNFNYLKKPCVEFFGEAGSDVGALSREYFWKGIIAISKDKFDGKYLFEGEANHRLPTIDSKLLRCGVYQTIGKFMAHAIIHCGIGFVGLSEAAVEYLTEDDIDSDTPITIAIEDVPDFRIRTAITSIQQQQSGATLTAEEQAVIQEVANNADLNEPIDHLNGHQAMEHILYHSVIERRRPYLDAIKLAMKKTGLFSYILGKRYLRSGMFPRTEHIEYPPNVIIDRIQYFGDSPVFQYIKTYISTLSGPLEIQNLLRAWTGWPVIPETGLELQIEPDCEFKANTCFNSIQVPSDYSQTDVTKMFDLLRLAMGELTALSSSALICIQESCQLLETVHNYEAVVVKLDSLLFAITELNHGRNISWGSAVIQKLELAIYMLISAIDTPERSLQSSAGRPTLHIPVSSLEYLLSIRFKVSDIAKMYGVSRHTVFRRLRENNLSVLTSYTNISEEDLHSTLEQILTSFPNTGYKRMKGFLLEAGIKVTDLRVRVAMRVVDPAGVYQRTLSNRAIVRRQYNVSYFNQLWHLDTNMKLIRWNIVIRSCIDGKSRLVVYLHSSGDNTAESNCVEFLKAVSTYGVPWRTRSDKGGENVLIARFMIEQRGIDRASHICGRSVHNQRIERYWRDVFYGYSGALYNVFTSLEIDGFLNVDNPKHVCLLHKIFLPRINRELETFRNAWNNHPLSSERNYSPTQLMVMFMPPIDHDMELSSNELDDINFLCNSYEDLLNLEQDAEDTITTPQPNEECLSVDELERLNSIDVLRNSCSLGYDIFVEAVALLDEYRLLLQ